MPSIPHELLRNVTILAALPDSVIREIGEKTSWSRYDRRQQIVSEGDPSTDVFFVVEGVIEAKSFSSQGKEVTYSETRQGGLFGEFSAIDGEPRSATVIAIEPCLIGRMTAVDFVATLLAHPELHMRLTESLVAKARSMSRRIYEFSTLAVRNRIHAELLRLGKAGTVKDGAPTIEPAPTHHELATRVSTHREAVTRELNQLASSGIIELGNRRIAIREMEQLQNMVETPPFE